MKTIHKLALFILLIVSFSCKKTITGEGEIKEVMHPLPEENITTIDLEGNFEAVLIQDSLQGIIIEAQQNLVDNLEIKTKGGKLYISEKENVRTEDIYKVYINSLYVENINLSRTVAFDVSGMLEKDKLKIQVSGASKMAANVRVKELQLDISGASSATLSGNVVELEADISGASSCISPELITTEADVDISGSSQMMIEVLKKLKGEVSGASILEYKGNPDKNINTSGASTIKKVN